MKDLRSADVPFRHHFGLTDETPIHYHARRVAPLSSHRTSLKTPLTTFFNVFSIDFAGPLPLFRAGNKYTLVCVEHLTALPIVVSTSNSTAGVVINFVFEHVLEPLRFPRVIVLDNATFSQLRHSSPS